MEEDRDTLLNGGASQETNEDESEKPCFPYRYQLLIVLFIGMINAFTIRTSFNIALVDMVNYTSVKNYSTDVCFEPHSHSNKSSNTGTSGEFSWNSDTQSLLLGGFFYGYIITQFIGGYVSEVYGPKKVICLAVLGPAVLNIISPWAAKWSPNALFATRLLMGITQGPLFPSFFTYLRNWSPKNEMTITYAVIGSGSTLGTFIGPLITGYLCDLSFLGGWPLTFYIFGALGLVWSVVWMYLAYDHPRDNLKLSNYERRVIEKDKSYSPQDNSAKRPVFAMVTSRPVWVLLFYYVFDGLSYYGVFSGVPIFMKQVLQFDISENGLLYSLANVGMLITAMTSGFIADWLRINYLSTKNTRKLFHLIGEGSQSICMLVIALWPCKSTLVVIMYTVGLTMNGFAISGASVNWLDIAPKYAGTLMGVGNFVTNVGGFAAPLVIGKITKDSPDRSDWQTVFYLMSGTYAMATLIFVLFGEGEEQSWAKDQQLTEPIVTTVNSGLTDPQTIDAETQDGSEEDGGRKHSINA